MIRVGVLALLFASWIPQLLTESNVTGAGAVLTMPWARSDTRCFTVTAQGSISPAACPDVKAPLWVCELWLTLPDVKPGLCINEAGHPFDKILPRRRQPK